MVYGPKALVADPPAEELADRLGSAKVLCQNRVSLIALEWEVKLPSDHNWQAQLDDETSGIWRFVEAVLGNSGLLRELKFSNRNSVGDVWVVLTVSDRLHPTDGCDYLGSNWEQLDDDIVNRALNQRNRSIDAILREVIEALSNEDYETAIAKAATTEHQVVYLSRSEQETRSQLQALFDAGLYIGDFQDHRIERAGDGLVVCFRESYSWFVKNIV